MSDFHYVRTLGSEGGVDAAEGHGVGIDLESMLDSGLPPFSVVLEITAAVAEILAIADEDGVVHGDLEPKHVLLDNTGAISVEGFGATRTNAPEGRPRGAATDRFGLGALLFALLSPRDLPPLPRDPAAYEDAAIDAILMVNLEGLPDHVISDVQWYLVRLLAYEPKDRPAAIEAWRALDALKDDLDGPDFARWCDAANEGKGQRRDNAEASRPMPKRPLGHLHDTTVSGGPLPKGTMNFEDVPPDDKNTGWWTPDGLKSALQRALTSDYLEEPDTGWMPGTPIPPLDRSVGADTGTWRRKGGANQSPRRAPGEAERRRAPKTPDQTFSGGTYDEYTDPRGELDPSSGPNDDAATEMGGLGVPLQSHTPGPTPGRDAAPSYEETATASQPSPVRPTRKPRSASPPKDQDTQPEFVKTGPALSSMQPQPRAQPPSPAPAPPTQPILPAEGPPTIASPPPARRSSLANAPGPVPMPDLSRGPDPFAGIEEDTDSPNVPALAAIGVLVVMASFLCVGTVGVGGMTAMMGYPTEQGSTPEPRPLEKPGSTPQPISPKDPKPVPKPSLANAPKPMPAPQNFAPPPRVAPAPFPKPLRPQPARPQPQPLRSQPARPVPQPLRPQPARPLPQPARPLPLRPIPQPARPLPLRPLPTRPQPAPAPPPLPAPQPVAPFLRPAPQPIAPFPTPAPRPLTGSEDSILSTLLPTPVPGPNGKRPSEMQTSMMAHFAIATAARDAVIRGEEQEARNQAARLEFLQSPSTLPPNWQPYVVDLKLEAWMMGNSPDLGAAGFKIAQVGAACASCHAGVHAGPTVDPARVPPRQFPHKDVMRKHSWALDWMWVGLIASDNTAWNRGAKNLAESPFASAVLEGTPEPKFVELEDRLHALAIESQTTMGSDKKAAVYGKLLATCASCHVLYRKSSKR